jgi:hypothetical protein
VRLLAWHAFARVPVGLHALCGGDVFDVSNLPGPPESGAVGAG